MSWQPIQPIRRNNSREITIDTRQLFFHKRNLLITNALEPRRSPGAGVRALILKRRSPTPAPSCVVTAGRSVGRDDGHRVRKTHPSQPAPWYAQASRLASSELDSGFGHICGQHAALRAPAPRTYPECQSSCGHPATRSRHSRRPRGQRCREGSRCARRIGVRAFHSGRRLPVRRARSWSRDNHERSFRRLNP